MTDDCELRETEETSKKHQSRKQSMTEIWTGYRMNASRTLFSRKVKESRLWIRPLLGIYVNGSVKVSCNLGPKIF